MNDTGSWNFFEPHRASERHPATALTVRGQCGVLQVALQVALPAMPANCGYRATGAANIGA
jgi:hypothetical protein